jgi:hypothetical protein
MNGDRSAALRNNKGNVAAMPPGDLPSGPLQLIQLGGLDRDAALGLIAEHAGVEIGPHNIDAADAVWRATGGLPAPLVMAAAAATRGPGGSLEFPPAEILPQPALDRLSEAEREIVMLLGLAGPAGMAPELLTGLTTIRESTGNPLDWLTRQGLVTPGERGPRLVPDVAHRLGPKLRPAPADAERICGVLTSWVSSPQTPPRAVADHVMLINTVIDLATATGHQAAAARLARAASPALAVSLRYHAWHDLLTHGLNAARHARDQETEAYLVHEAGVLQLTGGAPQQAVPLLADAAMIWDRLGEEELSAAARANLARNGLRPPPTAPAPAPRRSRTRVAVLVIGLISAIVVGIVVAITALVGSVSHSVNGFISSMGNSCGGDTPGSFVHLNDAAVQSGDQVIITGGGFQPGETVYIDFNWGDGLTDNGRIRDVVANAQGDFGPISAPITGSPDNSYSINAAGEISGRACAPITIMAG